MAGESAEELKKKISDLEQVVDAIGEALRGDEETKRELERLLEKIKRLPREHARYMLVGR